MCSFILKMYFFGRCPGLPSASLSPFRDIPHPHQTYSSTLTFIHNGTYHSSSRSWCTWLDWRWEHFFVHGHFVEMCRTDILDVKLCIKSIISVARRCWSQFGVSRRMIMCKCPFRFFCRLKWIICTWFMEKCSEPTLRELRNAPTPTDLQIEKSPHPMPRINANFDKAIAQDF